MATLTLAPGAAIASPERRRRGRLRFFLAVLRARPLFALGYAIVALVVITGALAPFIAPYGPMVADPNVYLLPPGAGHGRFLRAASARSND